MTKPTPEIFNNVPFVKSSKSSNNGSCVEIARSQGFYGVRDSKTANSPVLVFTPDEWEAFTAGVRGGEFD